MYQVDATCIAIQVRQRLGQQVCVRLHAQPEAAVAAAVGMSELADS
jgi:hypothetical protein